MLTLLRLIGLKDILRQRSNTKIVNEISLNLLPWSTSLSHAATFTTTIYRRHEDLGLRGPRESLL